MSPSKTGLNAEFYKWIDDVRRAMRKEKELQEKLRYYNMKLVGCKSVSFDQIGPTGTASLERDIYFWIHKIKETEYILKVISQRIVQFSKFLSNISDSEREVVMRKFQEERIGLYPISQGSRKTNAIIESVKRKWWEWHMTQNTE